MIDYVLQKIISNKLTTDIQKLQYLKLLYCNTKYYRDNIFVYIEYLRNIIKLENNFLNR